MRRLLAMACVVALSACAVPHERGDTTVSKIAAQTDEVKQIIKRYAEVRGTAAELLDAKPLSTVEAGGVQAIDAGSFELAQQLNTARPANDPAGAVVDVQVPRFTKYPMWFYAVVKDQQRGINRVQVFERASAVEPWFLMASPEVLAATSLPTIRSSGGAPTLLNATDGRGLSMSVADAAKAYAETLTDPDAAAAAQVENDSFIQQMRQSATSNAALANVRFSQQWSADTVQYALRTSDGGALAFVTLIRTDSYDVEDGLTVTWPEGTPQQAFLASGIAGAGQLTYLHQVLMYLPGNGAKPRALGQFGGVVRADSAGLPR